MQKLQRAATFITSMDWSHERMHALFAKSSRSTLGHLLAPMSAALPKHAPGTQHFPGDATVAAAR
ncbi:hypothetical protein JQN63_19945 [Delftia lacustris]|jgi:hypothetical protein|uniref:hypothetical protein n=1 Tax=Delftia TaxID=80865 RepID=UPI00193C0410|nr:MULTISPECIES: hypothetical protein [Delftia]QRI93497.1 hypothetical protein JQN63_19945 [Delftia lacustris]